MKVCVAQTRPVVGNIERNLIGHEKLIAQAVDHEVGLILFPELSLTGYEPTVAVQLATDQYDPRLLDLQRISDREQLFIGIGLPIERREKICIGTVLLRPHETPQIFTKRYLHPDEEAFFIGGTSSPSFLDSQKKIALAICYEISVPKHVQDAFEQGTELYMASVAKTKEGVFNAHRRLKHLAKRYNITSLMANCIGNCDDTWCAGGSAIWNHRGELLGQLDDVHEGILTFDMGTEEVTTLNMQ